MQIGNARFIAVFVVIIVGAILVGIWAMRPPAEENGAPGQAPAEDERVDRPALAGVGAIAGEVRIFKTGEAAGRTVVRIEGGKEPVLLETGDDGRFRSPVPSGTELTVTVEAAEPLAPVVLKGVIVERGKTEDLGTLYLDRSFRIRGVVVDRNGGALAGARVEVFRSSADEQAQPGFDFLSLLTEMGEIRTPLEAAETAADGGFVLSSLAPGTYRIEAAAEGFAVGVLPTATVSPAKEDATIRIVLGPGSALVGTVKDSKGMPVEGAAVTVIRGAFFGIGETDIEPVQTLTNAVGSYQFTSLTPGSAMVMVRSEKFGLHVSGDLVIGRTERLDIVIGGDSEIRGRVTDGDDKPVEGAEVVLAVETGGNAGILGRAVTDEEGHYRIAHLPAKQIQMFAVRKDGFPPYPPGGDMFGQAESPGILEPGKPLVKDVTLVAGTALTGRVLDAATRRPIPGAEVSALSPSVMGLGKGPRAVTDASGAYRIEGMGEGTHILFARAPGYFQAAMSEALLQQAFSFDSSQEPSPDTPVVTIEGKPDEVTKDLILQTAVTVSGRVLSPAGEPVGGARVSVAPENNEMASFFAYFKLSPPPVLTDENGGFRLSGAPASDEMRLAAQADGYVMGVSEPFRTTAGSAADQVTIRLRAGGTLSGTVYDADGRPLAGAFVRVIPAPEGEEENSWNASWKLEQTEPHVVGEDGTFRIEDLAPGQVWARFEGPGHQSKLDTSLSVPEGGVSDGHAIRLERGLVISGRVTTEGGEPIAGANIWVNREQQSPQDYSVYSSMDAHRTDENGEFEIDRLGSGSYTLRISAESYVSERREGVAAGTTNLDLILEKGIEIEGTVFLPDGNAAPNIWVHARDDEGNSSSAQSNSSGGFKIESLRAGEYVVEAQGMGRGGDFNIRPTKVSGVAAGSTNVEIRLLPGFRITGVVVDGSGRPVAGAQVWATPMDEAKASSREGPSGWAQTQADGSFEMRGLDDGRYMVNSNHESQSIASPPMVMGGETGVRIVLDARTEPAREGMHPGIREAEPIEIPEPEEVR